MIGRVIHFPGTSRETEIAEGEINARIREFSDTLSRAERQALFSGNRQHDESGVFFNPAFRASLVERAKAHVRQS